MGMKRFVFSAGVVLAWAWGAPASIMWEPPVPPPGWEKNVTPGFEPGIEPTLVEWGNTPPHQKNNDGVRERMQAWGPKAVPVLAKIYADDAWKGYRGFIVAAMTVSGIPEAHAWLKERYLETVRATDKSDEWRQQVYQLSHALAQTGAEGSADLLAEQALKGDGEIQQAAISALSSMPSERSLKVFRELASREDQAKLMEYYLPGMEGRVRAQQPMAAVLEKEKAQ